MQIYVHIIPINVAGFYSFAETSISEEHLHTIVKVSMSTQYL